MSELFYYVHEKEMGRNKLVHVSMNEYIEVILGHIDIEKIQMQKFHLLINREMIRCNIYLCSFYKDLVVQLHGFMQANKRSCESFDEIK